MATPYAQAMAREAERLAAAQKRNMAAAVGGASSSEANDAKEDAWQSVFAAGRSAVEASEDAERRRKRQRKDEKRKQKQASEHANAEHLTLYVSGIPADISWTAVQALFARVGEVRRVKLYKDAQGNQKGDGLVTFASEDATRAALAREWSLHGEPLAVQPAKFEAKPQGVSDEDARRIVLLTHMFATEEVAQSASGPKAFLAALEEEIWVECLKHGPVQRVQAFAADPECAVAIRFADADAAAACVLAMDGRWFSERQIGANLYDGHRKRAPEAEDDDERIARLRRAPTPPPPPPSQQEQPPPPAGVAASTSDHAPATASAASAAAAASAASAAAAATSDDAPLTLPIGGYVKLRGLQSKPELNGSVGSIQSLDLGSGRYTVALRSGAPLALKRANLLQMLSGVRLAPLPADAPSDAPSVDASLHGQEGTIFEYDGASGMYGVELSGSGDAVPVPAGCAVLPDGAVGTIDGLSGAAHYNGLLAKVVSHDAEAARYIVRLDDGKTLRLRRQNLLA
jgi:HIV Tat-specific factor 1